MKLTEAQKKLVLLRLQHMQDSIRAKVDKLKTIQGKTADQRIHTLLSYTSIYIHAIEYRLDTNQLKFELLMIDIEDTSKDFDNEIKVITALEDYSSNLIYL